MRSTTLPILPFLLTFGALLGCSSPSPEDVCDYACDCETCDADKRAECVAEVTAVEKAAEQKNCSAAYDTFIDCFTSQTECKDGDIEQDVCDAKLAELEKCVGNL